MAVYVDVWDESGTPCRRGRECTGDGTAAYQVQRPPLDPRYYCASDTRDEISYADRWGHVVKVHPHAAERLGVEPGTVPDMWHSPDMPWLFVDVRDVPATCVDCGEPARFEVHDTPACGPGGLCVYAPTCFGHTGARILAARGPSALTPRAQKAGLRAGPFEKVGFRTIRTDIKIGGE